MCVCVGCLLALILGHHFLSFEFTPSIITIQRQSAAHRCKMRKDKEENGERGPEKKGERKRGDWEERGMEFLFLVELSN